MANTGVLRGDTILILELPVSGEKGEVIGVSKEKSASRSFVPRPRPTAVNIETMPDALWQRLELLWQEWCTQPPTFPASDPKNAYKATFQCGRLRNPVIVIPPDQLPAIFADLIQFMPPAPT